VPIVAAIRRNLNVHRTRLILTVGAGLTAVLVASLGLLGCSSDDGGAQNRGAAAARGRTLVAPDFALRDLAGQTVRLSDYRGKVVLVDFWATWCGPCRMSIPHLKELYAEYASQGLEIIGVAIGDKEELVRRFVDKQQIDYVTVLGDQAVAMDYGITNIPTAFLLDQDGNVAARYLGYQQKRVLEEAIRQLL
jgi:thiol-disulfide isomerase/thioredoxin